MRKYFTSIMLAVFFAAVSYYLFTTLNPFSLDTVGELIASEEIEYSQELIGVLRELFDRGLISEYLNWQNVNILMFTTMMSLLGTFIFIHLIIDRLFISKFYQKVSVPNAVRRGGVLVVGVISLFYLNIYRADVWLSVFAIVFLLIVEIFVSGILRRNRNRDTQEEVESKGGLRTKVSSFWDNIVNLVKLKREELQNQADEIEEDELD